ncbi:MAG TPA: putative 2OG-Fe(II) oxygenase, partial [Acidobacteriaceae bacterium]|nr:putative 2OG-Fe(II) oxygenase [Acidobacteriaceae bacterium]
GNTDQVVLKVQNGTLLIFPAYVPHSVDANASVEERVSISFNVMFSAFTQNLSKPLWGDQAGKEVPVTYDCR